MNVKTLATVLNLLSLARRCTRAEAGTVYLREADGLTFLVTQNDKLARFVGRAGSADLLTRVPLRWTERSIATYAALTGTPLNIPDAYAIPRDKPYSFNPRIDSTTGFHTISMLVVPVRYPINGVLQLINATDENGDVVSFSRAAETDIFELVAFESELSPWVMGQA
jgi:GAF domain-containing protein